MKIIIFAYNDQSQPPTFIQQHVNDLAGSNDYLMHLKQWSSPMLGNLPLWGKGIFSRAIRRIKLQLGKTARELHEQAFYNALRRERPDAVLAEFGYSGTFIVDSCRKLNIPLLVHFHGTDVCRRKVVEDNWEGYQKIFKHAKYLIAVSQFEKNLLINLGAKEDTIKVIACGARLPQQKNIPQSNNEHFNIISVTRMAEVKSPHLTLIAFYKFLSLNGNGTLHMVGDGPLLHFCKSIARGMGIEDNCIFHGNVAHDKVYELLKTSNMYVQHSVIAHDGNCEGMPVSIMEAAAFGLPIVTTAHVGIPEHIKNNDTGLLVNEYDTEGMAKAMYEVWKDKSLASKLGKNAQELAYKRFNANEQSLKILKLIKDN
jgi:colanic acid/amylovoran biosynthesis glycosyltransferase